MSSLVSGIAKVFAGVGTGVAATLGSAVRGVGATLFTSGAATGTAAGGLSSLFGGSGILGNLFKGVGSVLASGPAGVLTTAAAAAPAAATAAAGGAAAPAAGFWASLGEGLTGAATATGATPALAATTGGATGGFGKAIGSFLGSQAGAGAIAGLGAGVGGYLQSQALQETAQADRDAIREREKRITQGYDVPESSLVGGGSISADQGQRPTPTNKYARPKKPTREVWTYNPENGRIETVRA